MAEEAKPQGIEAQQQVTAAAEAAPSTPSIEERITALEGKPKNADNAWMIVACALVLFMTLPGLALFYGGLVRAKNVLSVLAQCLGIAGLVTIMWWAYGYSLAFSTTGNAFIGGLDYAFFKGVDSSASGNISHNIFAMFQLMFAIITPALIMGAIAERMKFISALLFTAIWMTVVYFPMAHMVWGANGFLNAFNPEAGIKSLDFAGGTVVHMTAGWSSLVLCILLGKRIGYGTEKLTPHSVVLCMVGASMLWVGWFGFNAGSALAADGIATNAFTTTMIAAAVASFTWGMLEYIIKKKTSVLGFSTGVVAGLVAITPACGFVTPSSAVIIGIIAAIVPYYACYKLKEQFGYDDSLDAFGVHGVAGALGCILTGLLATPAVNPGIDGLTAGLLMAQLKAIVITAVLSVTATLIIGYAIKATIGLRVAEEVERNGLDTHEHGEEGYRHS
jgi:Amt family ammonium transporter